MKEDGNERRLETATTASGIAASQRSMYAINLSFEMASKNAFNNGYYSAVEGATAASHHVEIRKTVSLPSYRCDLVRRDVSSDFDASHRTAVMDDPRARYPYSVSENGGHGDGKRRCFTQLQFFNEISGASEGDKSCFSALSGGPPYDGYGYGRQEQQAHLKRQPLDSGIESVSDAAPSDVGNYDTNESGEFEPRKKNSFEESSLNDDFLNGPRGRVITATAPPHLRSCYSQESIFGRCVQTEEPSDGANLSEAEKAEIMDGNGGIEDWTRNSGSTINWKPSPIGISADIASPSTSGLLCSSSNVYFPHALFDDGGNIENSKLHSNALSRGHNYDRRPPPPPYSVAVGSGFCHFSRSPNDGTGSIMNGQEKSIGQAPMIITGANRAMDHGDLATPPTSRVTSHRSTLNMQRHGQESQSDRVVPNLTPRFDSSFSAPMPVVSTKSNSGTNHPIISFFNENVAATTVSASPIRPDCSSVQSTQRVLSVENVHYSAPRHPSLPSWPSTPCIANGSSSNSYCSEKPTAASAGTYCVHTTSTFVTLPTSVNSIQSARISSFLKPLPEIRENVAVVSLPTTPTVSEPSPYLLPSIISDRESSWFSQPWTSVRTGAVSRLVKAVSCDPSAGTTLGEGKEAQRSPKDVNYLSNLHRVTKLAEHFEKGDVDHVGPLKLYHARVYKRELEKICAENFGMVLTKAQRFDSGVVSFPHRSPQPPVLLEVKDNGNYQRASFSSSCVSDDIWSRYGAGTERTPVRKSVRILLGEDIPKAQGISFTKTFPTASEPNLNAGQADLPDFTLTEYNDQGGAEKKREGRRSRRTSYVMATTASPRNVVASLAGTQIGGGRDQRSNKELAVSYPAAEGANISARHRDLHGEDEEADCGNRRGNARGLSSMPNTLTAAGEGIEKTSLETTNGGRSAKRLQRQGLGQEAPRLSGLQIPDSMERKNSSGSSLSVTPTPTPSPTSGTKHARIQRFINFFSGDNSSLARYSDGCVAGPGSSTSLSSCYTGASSSSNQTGMIGDRGKRMSSILPSPPTIEGPLAHKQVVSQIGGGRKWTTDRNWRDYWAVLHGSLLYLCRERPSIRYRSEMAISDEMTVCYGLPEDALRINVESCIADIAYDYLKRKHVFRVTTQRQTEHLFQATDSQTMIRWIESLQRCSANENQLDGISSSMALIIKRYEAQSQSVSPSVKQRRPAGVGGSKSPSSVIPNGQQELVNNRCENDGATFSLSSNRIYFGINSNPPVDKMERSEKGDNTPGKSRKWRRVRKSGSCPVPSPHTNVSGTNPDAMFGARLEECPTSGEDDFVPLIVQLCVKVVESQGLEAVGVYRIPGNTAAVNSLITTLDKGFEKANFNDSRWRDVNVVSSLLKAYFRKLPDPLLTDKLYQQFIEASRIENHTQKLKRIRSLVEKLPKVNYETLKYVLFHLRRVVSHSGVNKMEARNLALMFGPSLVRPCGDSSMTTMVTHMSDQCKIVELLITYCDWIFSPVGKNCDVPNVPPPLENSAETDLANTSFADMTDLLRRVKTTEEDLERTKDSIVKTILNVRRGSRKQSKGKLALPQSIVSLESSNIPQPRNFASCSGRITSVSYNGHNGHEMKAASASPSAYNERNIDEEIESRQQKAALAQAAMSTSSKGVLINSKSDDRDGHSEMNGTNGTNGSSKGSDGGSTADVGVVFRSSSDNPQQAAAEMRRRREDHIYAARRIFIVGTEGNEVLQRTPPVDTVAKMDLLAQHSRHLNINPQSLDILSPETREKIRRLQTDSHLLSSKGHWQAQQLKKVADERQRIELAWERAKQDYEQDDFLDNLAENPRAGLAFISAVSNPHLSLASTDALSTSSDYSTTSSIMAGFDGAEKQKLQALQQQQKLMSVSCTGALPLSDCSSEDPSPYSCSPKPAQGLHGAYGTVSPLANAPPIATMDRSSVEQPIGRPIPYQPPSFCAVGQRTSHGSAQSSPKRRQQVGSPEQLYDRSRLKHVAPEALFHSKTSSEVLFNKKSLEEQRMSYVSVDGGSKYEGNPRHSSLQRARPWYDELADDDENEIDSRARDGVASSSDASHREPKSALDQNANNLTSEAPTASSLSKNADATGPSVEQKRTRILAPVERGHSRISQKIKFRSKSSSAEKRKDNRRHTLTDMETIKNVLFGGASSREHAAKEKAATIAPPSNSTNKVSPATATMANNKQSKTGKLKAWLKESFRKSSPDLYDADDLDENEAEDGGPKAAV